MPLLQRNKNTLLLVTLMLALVAKLLIDGFVDMNKMTGTVTGFNLHKQFSVYMNWDDVEMAGVARNVVLGKGFVTDISYDRPKFRAEAEWPTAFRPKLNVLVHVAGLKLYTGLHPEYKIEQDPKIPDAYFNDFATAIFIIKNLLFVISLFYFYQLSCLFLSKTASLATTLFYCIYPSIILYVGIVNIFECAIMPILVIIMSMHLYNRRHQKGFSPGQILFITATLPIICFLKMQVCLVVLLFYIVAGIDALLNRQKIKQYAMAYMPANLLMLAFICYNFSVNQQAFGELVFSTQSSLNLWHGHNEFARGSWNPAIWQQHYAEIEPVLEKNKNQLAGNEITETAFYKKWAIDWIKTHPKEELVLCLRKAAIYFLPENSNSHKINLLALLVHVGFFGFVVYFILYQRTNIDYYYLLATPAAILLVSIIYFVEYRWRYLADPFMLLLACIFVSEIYKRFGHAKTREANFKA